MTEAFAVSDEPARKLSLEMVGEVVGQTIAASLDDTRTGRGMLASLLAHELAGCHCLMLRFTGFANAFLDRAGPVSVDGAGERARHEAMRLAGTAARLTERYRVGALTLLKLRTSDVAGSAELPALRAAAKECGRRIDTLVAATRGAPAGHGVDRSFSAPAAGQTRSGGPSVFADSPPRPADAPVGAARGAPAGHGVDRPFSAPAAGQTESAEPSVSADGSSRPADELVAASRDIPAGHGVDRPFSAPAAGEASNGPSPMSVRTAQHGDVDCVDAALTAAIAGMKSDASPAIGIRPVPSSLRARLLSQTACSSPAFWSSGIAIP